VTRSRAGRKDLYRPLRPRSLRWQLVALVLGEAVILSAYALTDALFHWSTHFLVGLTAAAVYNLLVLAIRCTPAPGQLASILVLHLVAMVPDLVFPLGVPHLQWMDVFLGHNSAHYVPGGDAGWLAIALTATTVYVAVLSAWLHARTRAAKTSA
jgi:hypothetical protein